MSNMSFPILLERILYHCLYLSHVMNSSNMLYLSMEATLRKLTRRYTGFLCNGGLTLKVIPSYVDLLKARMERQLIRPFRHTMMGWMNNQEIFHKNEDSMPFTTFFNRMAETWTIHKQYEEKYSDDHKIKVLLKGMKTQTMPKHEMIKTNVQMDATL